MMTGSRGVIDDSAFRTRSKRWLAHTSEFIAPLLRAGAMLATRSAPRDPAMWRNGLIMGHNHIGDVLYRTCSLQQLADGLPDCRWSYLTSPSSAELLVGNPAVSEVLSFNTGENSWDLGSGSFGELRRREFDVALCTNTLRHYPDIALAVALGIPNRVGFGHKGLSALITRTAPISFPSAYPAYFRGMVADLTSRAADWPLEPKLFPTRDDNAAAAKAWDELGLSDAGPVVACSLATRQAAGNWPRGHLLQALETARAQAAFTVVLCGSAADSADLSAVARQLSFPVRVLADRVGLRAYAAFLARCSALLTLDSGPRHIGNAAGIPVLFARNLSHSRIEAGKYCKTEFDLAPPLEYLSDAETIAAVAQVPVTATSSRLLEALAPTPPVGAIAVS